MTKQYYYNNKNTNLYNAHMHMHHAHTQCSGKPINHNYVGQPRQNHLTLSSLVVIRKLTLCGLNKYLLRWIFSVGQRTVCCSLWCYFTFKASYFWCRVCVRPDFIYLGGLANLLLSVGSKLNIYADNATCCCILM